MSAKAKGTRAAVIPERVEQARIVQLLRSLGAKVWVTGTHRRAGEYQGTMMTPGLPDVFAFLPRIEQRGYIYHPQLLVIEVKSAKGRLRPEQEDFRDQCLSAGVNHFVGGLDALIAWLTARGYLRQGIALTQPPTGGQS